MQETQVWPVGLEDPLETEMESDTTSWLKNNNNFLGASSKRLSTYYIIYLLKVPK